MHKLGLDSDEKVWEKTIDYPNQEIYYKRHEIAHTNPNGKILGIFENRVFDLTSIAESHPGGHRIIKSLAGTDMTVELKQAHFYDIENIKSLLKKYCIGQLKEPLIEDGLKHVVNKWIRVLFMISEIQNNLQNIWFFDQAHVGDRKRQVPFHFVMKTLSILFGHEGYLDSLLSIIDNNLLTLYRDKDLKHFKSLRGDKNAHKFIDIGQLAIEYGQDEIKYYNLQTIDETLVNNLIVSRLYNKLVLDSLAFFTKLQNIISKAIDEIYEGKYSKFETDSYINELVKANIFSFINEVDSEENFALVYPIYEPNKKIEPNYAFLLNACANMDQRHFILGALSLVLFMTIFEVLVNNKIEFGVVAAASATVLAFAGQRFFNQAPRLQNAVSSRATLEKSCHLDVTSSKTLLQ
ncbi:cytochrome b5-like heme/steroid binding domain-containing protein [Legionella fairfieldensis]|uniref:cytochrome b5-like heme/steroid binding domain-containing protein n=1 Tax=Legionella fairfieldensis TaxID=45064 RepID=UPI0004903272|nr:cytochrome b5-like heme/steroid binding domain-containing protein [Legionella fairfieldensis]